MSVTETIVKIHDLFDGWRVAGSARLPNGVELLGRTDEGGEPTWLHAVFPGLSAQQLARLQHEAGVPFPQSLRTFYRVIGGMTLFHGAFATCGIRATGVRPDSRGPEPESLPHLNHAIDVLGWKPRNAVAFAVNAWDQSVHIANMGVNDQEIVRCDRATGNVLERHPTVFDCIHDRLYKLDQLMLR